MNVDRRRAERERRAALRVSAVFAVKSVVRGRLQLGQAEDVGPGGLTLRRPKEFPLAVGTGVVLTFALPGLAALVRVSAIIVSDRLEGSFRRTGIRFSALAHDVERQLTDFCVAQLPSAYLTASVA
jgi:hypothetical protein